MMKKYSSGVLSLSLCLASVGQAVPALAANAAIPAPLLRSAVAPNAAPTAVLNLGTMPAGVVPLPPAATLPAFPQARIVTAAPAAGPDATALGSVRRAVSPEAAPASAPENASDLAAQSRRLDHLYDLAGGEGSAELVSVEAAAASPRAARLVAAGSSRRPAGGKSVADQGRQPGGTEPVLRPEPRPRSVWPKVGVGVAVGIAAGAVALHGLFPLSMAYGALTGAAAGYTMSGVKYGDPRADSELFLWLLLPGFLAIDLTMLATGGAIVPSFLSISAGALSGAILGLLGHRKQFLEATHDLFPPELPYREGSVVSEAQKKLVSAFLDGKPSESQILDVLRDFERPQGEWLLQEMVARARTPVDFMKAVGFQQTIQAIEYRTRTWQRVPAGPHAYNGDWSRTHTLNTFLISILYTRAFWDRFIASKPSFEQVMEMRRRMVDTFYYETPPANDHDRAWKKPWDVKSAAIMMTASLRLARTASQFLEALARYFPEEVLVQNLDVFSGLKPTLAEWASLLPRAKSMKSAETAAKIRKGALGRVRTPQDYLSIAPFIGAVEGFPVFLATQPTEKDVESQLKAQVGLDYGALAEFSLKALPLTGNPGDYIKVVDALHGSVPNREKYLVYVQPKILETLSHFRSMHPTQEESDALGKVLFIPALKQGTPRVGGMDIEFSLKIKEAHRDILSDAFKANPAAVLAYVKSIVGNDVRGMSLFVPYATEQSGGNILYVVTIVKDRSLIGNFRADIDKTTGALRFSSNDD